MTARTRASARVAGSRAEAQFRDLVTGERFTSPQVVVIRIPIEDTKRLLTSNQRLHWTKKGELTRDWRYTGQMAVIEAGSPRFDRAHIVATFTWPDKRRRDPMNWWPTIKALVDGMVQDGRMLPDDDDAHLIGPDLRRDPERGPCSVRVEVREVGA